MSSFHHESNGFCHPNATNPPIPLQSKKSPFKTPETPVLIIGGGPIGVFCGILLARYNIRSTIVERHIKTLDLPKAHTIGPRTVEIFRQIGLDVDLLRSLGPSPEDVNVVRFLTCLVGYEYGKIPLGYSSNDAEQFTPEPLFNIPQPFLEDYLYEVALQTGLVTVWRGIEWQGSSLESDGVENSLLYNKRTNTVLHMRSKYLLACDGANAGSRTHLGISFSELPNQPVIPTHYVTVYFQADLRKLRNGLLFFIMSPSRLGTFICYDRCSTWSFVMIYDPATTPTSTFTEDYCRSAIAAAIGEAVPFTIQSTTIWRTHPRVIDTYRAPLHPKAFVQGDAAHSFPPTGGLGLNTGFSDAHNLIWKIHAVESNWVQDPSKLLDSYDADRRPVALANAQQSYVNQRRTAKLVETVAQLGNDDSVLTGDAQKLEELEKTVMENWEHFNAINLQIGYIYGTGQKPSRPVGNYVPERVPGARLPNR